MCGITGFWQNSGASPEELAAIARGMGNTLAHRGPDDAGVWVDSACGIALAHRRLSVVDLTPEGHQPMTSAAGRYVISFNGEIYNYRDVRGDLEAAHAAPTWRGHSDTEVLLAGIEHWGLAGALGRLTGMFAFALWDRHERQLHLVRDRLGEKPLYYGWANNVFAFGSELKALRALPHWQPAVDRTALALFTRFGCVPCPHSIYQGIRKLPPASLVTLSAQDVSARHCPEPQAYWSLRSAAERGAREPFAGDDTAATAQLDALLRRAVSRQMVADVPLGAFLSGGVDSSTIVALMQAQSPRPVKTFSIGFHENAYNEARFAAAVAKHLGTDHTELYVSAEQAMAVIPQLPVIYDEPFADSSQIPTYLVSQLARRHVTVSLSGDGGDELFGGYNRYFWGRDIWRGTGWMPQALRQMLARGLTGVAPQSWDRLFTRCAPLLPRALRLPSPGDKLHKLARVLAVADADALYAALISFWTDVNPVRGVASAPAMNAAPPFDDVRARMMFLDATGYLPDDILAKVDRASMAVSLESRVPFLDHSVVEFAWRLPLAMKMRNNQGKWLLRQVLYRYVPQQLIERGKMGFSIPLDSWLRGPLRDWAEALLDPAALQQQGYFDPEPIRNKWREHLSGTRNWQHHLWVILMFQAWHQQHLAPVRAGT
ncbi:MAG: asparagine synthase (glutamine-hydrolyzing) [Betaproteobacteria bacterium]|nr:MAG: asparagine synthase (glutamine-hydrolyzing) [Betaproteobacteria bacterium]